MQNISLHIKNLFSLISCTQKNTNILHWSVNQIMFFFHSGLYTFNSKNCGQHLLHCYAQSAAFWNYCYKFTLMNALTTNQL